MYKKYSLLHSAIDMVGITAQLRHKGTMYALYDEMSFDEDYNPYPHRKLKNAIKSFGKNIEEDEKILLLFDTTLFGSASDGIILTDKKIYVKNLLENPCKVAYQDIDEIVISRKDGKLRLIDHNGQDFGTKYILHPFADGSKAFFECMNLAHFIVGFSALINANIKLLQEDKAELTEKEAQDLYDDCFLYKFHFEGEAPEPSVVDNFFERYEDKISQFVESSGLGDFVFKLDSGDEEAWGLLVEKLYQVLPMPFRMVVSEDKVRNIVLNNKDKILKRIHE